MATSTDIAAWWGAVIATAVLAWDVYKWRAAGPKLRMSVSTNMESINIPDYEGKTLVLINVTNAGDRPTTVTTVALFYFPSLWSRVRRRPGKSFVMPNPSPGQPLPYELKPGTVWMGVGVQDDQLERMSKSGYLECAVYHSHKDRPLRRRVVVRERPNRALNTDARQAGSARPPRAG